MKREKFQAYVWKSLFWYFGNLAIGCIPVLFMGLVFLASRGKLGFDDMQKQIHEGAVLFVSVAMIGGVMVDFLQSESKYTGRQIVVIILAPIGAISVLLLEYLFVVLKIINTDCFNITSGSSTFVLGFSIVYCVLNKINLLIREDTKHE
jgi:hypothetical protein